MHMGTASVNDPASFNDWKLTGAIGICYGLDRRAWSSMDLAFPFEMSYPYTTYDLRLAIVDFFDVYLI